MKIPVLRLLSLAAVSWLAVAAWAADEKSEKPAKLYLEDIIFDAKYLKQILGPKTLVVADAATGEIPAQALLRAKLDEKTKIFTLPEEATKPQLISSVPPSYPASARLRRDALEARFLVFVGADGNVKCLYCYETKEQAYAIVAADALIKWRYTPAKINGTAVPVILSVELKLSESATALSTFNGPKLPPSLKGNPAPPRPVNPGPRPVAPR